MQLISKATYISFAFLFIFCSNCNYNTNNQRTQPLLNQSNQIVVAAEEITVKTQISENTTNDCNKPQNEDEQLLCAAITKGMDEETLSVLKEDLQFVSRRVDLNGDGRNEVFVWIPTGLWGGSSGYPIIIFSQISNSYRKLWEVDQAWTPIILLDSKTNGWRDIAFQVGGGGAEWLYIVIKHNGKKYRNNKILEQPPKGEVLIDKDWNQSFFGPIPKQ